jgi:hypothetical protein
VALIGVSTKAAWGFSHQPLVIEWIFIGIFKGILSNHKDLGLTEHGGYPRLV